MPSASVRMNSSTIGEGTQSTSGSRFVETLLSVIETCRQQNRNVFTYVTEAIQAHFNRNPAPKPLIGV